MPRAYSDSHGTLLMRDKWFNIAGVYEGSQEIDWEFPGNSIVFMRALHGNSISCLSVCMYVYVCMYMYVCMYVRTYARTYVCTHSYTRTKGECMHAYKHMQILVQVGQ